MKVNPREAAFIVRMSENDRDAFKARCTAEERSMAQTIRLLIRRYMSETSPL